MNIPSLSSWKSSVVLTIITSFHLLAAGSSSDDLPPPCDSLIYCHGPLLHTVQMAEIYNDSKHFVDMALKDSPEKTLANFYRLMNNTEKSPSQDEVRAFVEANFLEPSSEFVPWDPKDWKQEPEFLSKILDPDLEEWAKELVALWKKLGRQTSSEVEENPEKYSLIYLKHPVIVPGGRFRETYYWDSYWTIEGLLLSEMFDTARGMLENFMDFTNTYGMIPNGGRVYYTRRSQPPYLIPMVKLYVEYTGDMDFVRKYIDVMENEFNFWENSRSIPVRDTNTGKVHKVSQYKVNAGGPRPESYREDYKIAENLTSDEEKERIYVELKSGAESGWDFSTRWFVKGDTNEGGLSDINVTAIAPVDLNSLLCQNARTLSDFYKELGDNVKSVKFDEIANVKNQTLAELFWDEEDGIWHDFNIFTMKKRKYFYLSNVHPIWSGCYGIEGTKEETLDKVIDYLHRKKVVDYIGGVPTSLRNSSQQWDFPNAWAPLEHLVIMGLYNARNISSEAEPLSYELAEKWVRTNYLAYQQTDAMFEKYDVTVQGASGGGGEYEVVVGFGWTNGVAMKLLNTFGDRLTATTGAASRPSIEGFSILIIIPTLLSFLIIINKEIL